MKAFNFLKWILVCAILVAVTGCEAGAERDLMPGQNQINQAVYNGYAPVKIEVMPLTEIIKAGKEEDGSAIRAYISLLDKFDSQVKFPAVFRFELYQKIPYSGKPKGKRLALWPDIDLVKVDKNNEYWQDTFRTYKFELDFDFKPDQNYILQITCVLPNGQRLGTDFDL